MPRPNAEASAISFHICGQAIVTFDGISFYLGKKNSSEAFEKYAYLLKVYQSNGCRLLSEATPQSVRFLADDLALRIDSGYTETVNQADRFLFGGTTLELLCTA